MPRALPDVLDTVSPMNSAKPESTDRPLQSGLTRPEGLAPTSWAAEDHFSWREARGWESPRTAGSASGCRWGACGQAEAGRVSLSGW